MSRLLLLLALLLAACDSEHEAPQNVAPASTASAARKEDPVVEQRPKPQLPPPSAEQIARADGMLEYANRSLEYLDHGFYSLADKFYQNSRSYLETFKLPQRPKTGPRQELKPEAGLFDSQEAEILAKSLAGMDMALNSLLGHYASLEKYVADRNIRDNGVQGEKLAKAIAADHESFIASRKTWLEIVQARAAEAERVLLHGQPLQRQIQAGSALLGQMAEAARLLASDQADLLPACQQAIASLIGEGEKPPFAARPGLERLYRAFLKNAKAYLACLERGMKEGFQQLQRRELNQASKDCAASWNEFAKAVNGGARP